jgi:peptidoglycan/LPS O-acetylase OafA/YrhL
VNLQPAGLVLALVTFATIAAGHELVRRLHRRYGTSPAVPLFALGSLVLLAGLLSSGDLLSAALGIIGVTVIWDGVEIYRQEAGYARKVE